MAINVSILAGPLTEPRTGLSMNVTLAVRAMLSKSIRRILPTSCADTHPCCVFEIFWLGEKVSGRHLLHWLPRPSPLGCLPKVLHPHSWLSLKHSAPPYP